MRYRVLLQHDPDGYAASVPGLPGCWSQGRTEQEALDNVAEAIRDYLAVVDDEVRGGDVRIVDIPV